MKTILNILMSLFLSLAIISVSALLVLHFRPLYYYFIKTNEINNLYDLSKEEMKENYDTLVEYISGFGGKELELPHLPSSESGLIHFREVRDIFLFLNYMAMISFILLITLDRLFQPLLRNKIYLLSGGLLSLSLVVSTALFILADFSSAFVLFHKIAFRNDLWIFDYKTDPIILYLPERFFMLAALFIIGLILLFSFLSIFLSLHFQKKEKAF